MATTSIRTIETRVTTDDSEIAARSRQLANRSADLTHYAREGYTLAHTAVIEGTEYLTFFDTLNRAGD